jgi:hypothetical protein
MISVTNIRDIVVDIYGVYIMAMAQHSYVAIRMLRTFPLYVGQLV